jgi:glycosyltransferase involved in cell wall biosynthesis
MIAQVDSFRFVIATRDHDLGDRAPFANVQSGTWSRLAGVPVMYLGRGQLGPRTVGRLLRGAPHDVLYLHSLYSVPFTLWPLVLRRVRLVPRRTVVVAPRGQLHPGALALKAPKKRVFLAVARRIRLFGGVLWQATDEREAEYIRRWFGSQARITVARDLRLPFEPPTRPQPVAGPLRVVFLGRISENKNLHGALEILSGVRADVRFEIHGHREDRKYWQRCLSLIERLPANVDAVYAGPVEHEHVPEVMACADVLLMPTHGENFGHVIIEALNCGCLALISDQTPWRDLASAGVGWDLPLDDLQAFRQALEHVAGMDLDERELRARRAIEWAGRHDADPTGRRALVTLLNEAAAQ